MQTAWLHWVNGIAKKLSDQLGLEVSADELITPPDSSLGDLSFSCFRLAKEKKVNPAEAAKQIAAEFASKNTDIEKVTAVGPYVNFSFLTGDAVNRVVRDVEQMGEEYGDPAVREGRGRELLLEYAQPNTHKEIHVGHLRNLVLGATLQRLLDVVGWRVIPMSYHGDVGAHVAKCLWQLVKIQNPAYAQASAGRPKSKILTEKEAEEILKKITKNKRNGKFWG